MYIQANNLRYHEEVRSVDGSRKTRIGLYALDNLWWYLAHADLALSRYFLLLTDSTSIFHLTLQSLLHISQVLLGARGIWLFIYQRVLNFIIHFVRLKKIRDETPPLAPQTSQDYIHQQGKSKGTNFKYNLNM
jgi:hypothetical protein